MRRGNSRIALAVVVCVASIGATANAQEWTRFRGPNGSGIGDASDLPDTWTNADVNWHVALPGGGHGSPVLWGDRIFLLAATDDAARTVVCLHADDGRTLWTREYPGETFRMHGLNSYASSTPAADRDYVFVTWTGPEGVRLLGLDHEGREIWKRDLGPFSSAHGPGTSPMVHGKHLILANDQRGESFVIAVDRETGRTVWKLDRPGGRAAYAVPCVRPTAAGGTEILFASDRSGLVGVDPADGTVSWERTDAFPDRVVGSPVLAGRMILATCGSGGRGKVLSAVLPRRRGGPDLVYQVKGKPVPYVPTPLVLGERTYLLDDRGRLTCLRTADGEVLWTEEMDEKFFASPVCIDGPGSAERGTGRLVLVSTEGTVHVVRVGERCERLSASPLAEKAHATPAIAGGRVYVRTWSHLVSIGGK